jgi:sugar phosphate permease
MAWITHAYGWHRVYVVMGAGGLALACVWLRFMKNPADHRGVNRLELDYIEAGGGIVNGRQRSASGARKGADWSVIRQLLGNRMLLGVYLAQYCINVITYFFLTWFPIYLVQARHMTILKAGLIASLPAICGFLGGVLGGVASDALIRSGRSLTVARKVPIVGGMVLSSCIIGCNYVNSDWIVVALMSLAFFGKGLGALGWAVIADTAPREAIGLAGSIFNMFGNVAGIVTPIAIGYLVAESGSFNEALAFVGMNALITVISYLFIVKDIKRVQLKTA